MSNFFRNINCPICEHRFKSANVFRRHVLIVHAHFRFKCPAGKVCSENKEGSTPEVWCDEEQFIEHLHEHEGKIIGISGEKDFLINQDIIKLQPKIKDVLKKRDSSARLKVINYVCLDINQNCLF